MPATGGGGRRAGTHFDVMFEHASPAFDTYVYYSVY